MSIMKMKNIIKTEQLYLLQIIGEQMLLQHLKDLSSMQFQFTQDVMDLVPKIQHLHRS